MPDIIKKSKDFVKGLKSVDGALIIGSTAYGQNTAEKDVDLMIISADILDTLTSPSLQKLDELAGLKAESRLKYPNFSHCFKGCLDGVLWSPAIYTPQIFKEIVGLHYGCIPYVRNTRNSGIKIGLFDFNGASKEYLIHLSLP